MTNTLQKAATALLVSIFVPLLSSCGGGGGSSTTSTNPTTIAGIKMPRSMSVVTVKSLDTTNAALVLPGTNTPTAITVDANADYNQDEVHAYVYDASMESLETVNMILCLMDQTGATEMVNQGAYIALVDEDKCEQGKNQSSSGETGQSSGGQVSRFSNWTIDSTRADNSSPQIVKIWIPVSPSNNGPGTDPRDQQRIMVEVTASEGVSDTSPFGSFNLNFKGVVDASLMGGPSGTDVALMQGTLMTVDNNQNQPQFRFINLSGDALPGSTGFDYSHTEAANVILDDATGTGGVALTSVDESYNDGFGLFQSSDAFAIAFNDTHLLRGEDTNGDNLVDASSCKSRNDFDTQVWRYNLYHTADGAFNGANVTAGQRVELNSGFPFTYDTDNDGTDESQGWVGYHGIWSEQGDITDGTSITRFDYNSNASSQYTVHVAPGKLMRRSANTELLSSLQGMEFQYWGQHPTLNISNEWLVTVDGANDFQITGVVSWGDNGRNVSTTIDHDNNPATAEVSVVSALPLSDNQSLWLWSDNLGGNIVYLHENIIAAINRTVTYYAEEFITAGDETLFPSGVTSVTLYCYDQCLPGGLTQTDVDNATSNFDLYYSYAGTPFEYTLSVSNNKVLLTDNSNGLVVSAAGLDMTTLGNDWGINTGEMLTTPLANAAEPWRVYDEPVSYRFETGSNDWNQMTSVSDSQGVLATFDRPLQFNYTHSTANDANGSSTYDGDKFLLEYGGPGDLWGFPWVDSGENNRWYAAVTLADDVELSSGSNTFVVKAIEKELSIQDDPAGCAALNVDTLFADPALTLPTANELGTISFTHADKPVVTDPPAIIEGEPQGTL